MTTPERRQEIARGIEMLQEDVLHEAQAGLMQIVDRAERARDPELIFDPVTRRLRIGRAFGGVVIDVTIQVFDDD